MMGAVQSYLSSLSVASQTILVGAVFGITAYFLFRKTYRLPPGPMPLPLLGNILSLRNVPLYSKLAEWSKIYGPAMTIYLGPIRIVTLNNTDVVLEALVKKQADYAGRPQTYSTKMFSDGGKSIALGDYHATWRLHRKLATKALRYYHSGDQLEHGITDSLGKIVEKLKTEKDPVNPHKYNSLLAVNILCGVCFGETYDVDDDMLNNIVRLFDVFLTEFGNGMLEDVIPPLRLCPTRKFRKVVKLMDELFGIIDTFIAEHRQTFSADHCRDFTDSILLAQKEARDEDDEQTLSQITNEHIRQTVMDIFGAGIDTSRLTLDWAILYLAAFPEIQSKVHNEVDQVINKDGNLFLSYRHKLPYTDAVLHEVMRLSSVVPLSLPHSTICDTKIGDYDVPRGTMVIVNLWQMHHDPDKWTDVESFKPERFLDESGEMAPKPDSWLPFSAGRRVCLGESIAKPELLLLLAGYMRQFKISFPEGVEPDLEAVGGGFVRVPNPNQIIFKERD